VSIQAGRQLGPVDRFGQMVIHALLETRVPRTFHGVRRQCHDGHMASAALMAPNFCCRRIAIELGHLTVHQNEIVASRLPGVDRRTAVGHDVDSIAHLFEQMHRHFLVHHVIFRQQNVIPAA
jgi:hypothetical protein